MFTSEIGKTSNTSLTATKGGLSIFTGTKFAFYFWQVIWHCIKKETSHWTYIF